MKLFLLFAFLVTSTNAIYTEVFKNCSKTPFCKRLRDLKLDDASKFYIDMESIKQGDDWLTFTLLNANKKELTVLLTHYSHNIARVQIREPNNKRFELGNLVLVKKPKKKLKFEKIVRLGKRALLPSNDKSMSVGLVAGPPFKVEFLDKKLQILQILSGEKLLMENTAESQAFTFSVEFSSEKLYGLFDHAYKLSLGETSDRNMDPFRLRNSDAWAYEADSTKALYGSVPVIYGHSAGFTSGFFLHNAAEQWIDISLNGSRTSAYFMVEGASFDFFVLFGPTPTDVVRQLTSLTGKANLPQLWTLGYHQCRFSYESDEDVKTVANLMQETGFPMDAIWIDGYHTDDYKWFKWNHTTFRDPVGMQKNISLINKRCVTISDPHIKVEDTYDVYAGGKGKYFVRWENGSDYLADCWPGQSSWIDYFLQDAADYYASWFSYEKFNGSTPTLAGIWNDMNEPAIFDDSTEKSLPYETVHMLDNNGTTVKHRDVHNIYGIMHTKSTYKGLLERDNYQKRPFILTRSHFAGSQRYAAMWTGDNSATWQHFANSFSQCMTGNILGMAFCGADIGGFIGNPSHELLQRWYQGAAWLPFFRGHSSTGSERREPYLFPEDVQTVIRSAIRLRYKHIWHFYTLFYQHSLTGDPIISPLFYRYPEVQERDTQLLLGGDIMAIAVVNESVSSVQVLFPGTANETWYRFDTNNWKAYFGGSTENIEVDIKTSPVFYRGGSIVTTKDNVKLSTNEMLDDPYTLYINLDKDNVSTGVHYHDDFISFNYTKEVYLYFRLTYRLDKNEVTFERIGGNTTDMPFTVDKFVIHGLTQSQENGNYEVIETIYTTTKSGKVLNTINILEELLLTPEKKFSIHL